MYTSLKLSPNDHEEPARLGTKSKSFRSGLKNFKRIDLEVAPFEIKTDEGILLDMYKSKNYYDTSDITTDSAFLGQEIDQLLNIFVSVSQSKILYTRSYKKIQDVLAEVVGVVSGLLFTFSLLLYHYVRYKFFEDVINDTFDIHTYAAPSRLTGVGTPRRKHTVTRNSLNFELKVDRFNQAYGVNTKY